MGFKELSIEDKIEITKIRLQTGEESKDTVGVRNQLETYFQMEEFYNELESAIKNRLVLTEPSRIQAKHEYNLPFLCRHTGLSIQYYNGRSGILEICDFQAAKSYPQEGALAKGLELDFATLVTEKRAQVWEETVKILAGILVQRLDQMLSTLPTRMYGLNHTEKLDIGRYTSDTNGQAAEVLVCDDDPEWLQQLWFSRLTRSQLDGLARATNAIISHAEISFVHDEAEHLFMEVSYCMEKETKDAMLDYGEYLRKDTAKVSPALEQLFDEVVQRLEKVSNHHTLHYFDGMGRLAFEFRAFDRPKWQLFESEVFKNHKHWLELAKRIEENNPGIWIIKDAKYTSGIVDGEKLVFTYKLKDDASDELKQKHILETVIRDIIENKTMEVATANVHQVLCAINADTNWAKKFRETRKTDNADSDIFKIRLDEYDERLKGEVINIAEIYNREWKEKLNQLYLEIAGPDLLIKLVGNGFYGRCTIEWTA